jgi:hypothetical protein
MARESFSSRRDRRFSLRPGCGFVEFDYPPSGRRWRAALIQISVCGVSFEKTEDMPDLAPGTTLEGVSLRVGDCEVCGTIRINNTAKLGASGSVFGSLFYTASERDQTRLMGLIAGMGAIGPEPTGLTDGRASRHVR